MTKPHDESNAQPPSGARHCSAAALIAKHIWDWCASANWGNGKTVLTQLDFEQIISKHLNATQAATGWMKVDFDKPSITDPMPGEWGLWSFVTEHGREYYSGSYFVGDDGRPRIKTEYGWTAEAKDVYFARVSKLPVEETRAPPALNICPGCGKKRPKDNPPGPPPVPGQWYCVNHRHLKKRTDFA